MNRILTRTLAAGGALGLAAAGLAACSSGEAAAGEAAEITIIHAPVNYEVPYIAEREGIFDELDLDVTITPGGTPQDNLAQVMGGSADFTVVSWDTIVTATAEDLPIKAVGSLGVVSDEYDTSGVFVRADSGIESVEDLEGKTIAFNDLGGGPHICTMQLFNHAGFSADAFEAIKLPFASMATSLEGGHVDAVYPSDSFYEQMLASDDYKLIANPTRDFRSGLPITVWAATQPWLEENPETAERFLDAMEQATEIYEDPANHDMVIDVRTEVSDISGEQAEAMRSEFSVPIPLGVTQSVTDALVEFGAVENPDGVKTAEEVIWEGTPTTD